MANYVTGRRTLTVEEFHALVTPMEPYTSFDEVLHELSADPTETDLVSELVDALRSGPFDNPLWVHNGVLINGYHRYCALRLTNTPSFDVVFDLPQEPTPIITELSFPLPKPTTEDGDYDFDAFYTARSLYTPLGWIEADNISVHDGTLSYEYYAPISVVEEAVPLIVERLRRHGVTTGAATLRDASRDYD